MTAILPVLSIFNYPRPLNSLNIPTNIVAPAPDFGWALNREVRVRGRWQALAHSLRALLKRHRPQSSHLTRQVFQLNKFSISGEVGVIGLSVNNIDIYLLPLPAGKIQCSTQGLEPC